MNNYYYMEQTSEHKNCQSFDIFVMFEVYTVHTFLCATVTQVRSCHRSWS